MIQLTKDEAQQAYLLYGGDFHKFLGISRAERTKMCQDMGLLPPPDYVRSLPHEELTKRLILAGSFDRCAELLGVSVSFLKGVLAKPYAEAPLILDEAKFVADLTRIGSLALLARSYGLRESVLRSFAQEKGIDLRPLIRYCDSQFANGKGRKGELFFSGIRGDKIIKDLNMCEGTQAPADFEDADLGMVDVKASAQHEFRAKSRAKCKTFYKFDVSNLTCDYVYLVAFDASFQKEIGGFGFKKAYLPEGLSTITVNGLVFDAYGSLDSLTELNAEQVKKLIVDQDLTQFQRYDALRKKWVF